jgi:hypothetical protein
MLTVDVGIEGPYRRRLCFLLKPKILEVCSKQFFSRGAILKIELRIVGHEPLPTSSIGLSAFVIAELLENLSVGENLRHISQELVTTMV